MPQPRRQQATVSRQEKIERLQAAAISVIASRGMTEASTRAIANQAGLNLAAVHYAFDGKDDLLISVLESVLKATRTLITAVALDCKSAQAAIDAMAQAYWDHATQQPDLQRVNFELALYALTNNEYRERSQQQFSAFHEHVANIFKPLLPQWSEQQLAVLTVACISAMEGLAVQFLVMQNKETCEMALAFNVKALQLLCENPPILAG